MLTSTIAKETMINSQSKVSCHLGRRCRGPSSWVSELR